MLADGAPVTWRFGESPVFALKKSTSGLSAKIENSEIVSEKIHFNSFWPRKRQKQRSEKAHDDFFGVPKMPIAPPVSEAPLLWAFRATRAEAFQLHPGMRWEGMGATFCLRQPSGIESHHGFYVV
jgi:hypothetical protein